jgi:mRNA interferase MazF
VYLARLDPAKGAEVGKLRPVVVLSAEEILAVDTPLLFVCPLSSRSDADFEVLHVPLSPRDGLKVPSFALVEHCRAISRRRLMRERIAQLTEQEISLILHRLQRLVGL